jgi:diaminopropionate ammonia-lyase
MKILANPYRGKGLGRSSGLASGVVEADPTRAEVLFDRCPMAEATPLVSSDPIARHLGVGEVWLKDERDRMGMGSFKALGAVHAIADMAARRVDQPGDPAPIEKLRGALAGHVLACASAGNHGLSVAVGARIFGAKAVIYLSHSVASAFEVRLRGAGATVVRAGSDYEESSAAAAVDAERNGWTLLPDSSWPGQLVLPTRVMEGYLIMGSEVIRSIGPPPNHVFLQAGVGGMAAAMTALFRAAWGDFPVIVVVEPSAAPALMESIRAGDPVRTQGPISTMGRLDCKVPSHLALGELAQNADYFVTIRDGECDETVGLLSAHGLDTTPSGAAGLSALHHAEPAVGELGLDPTGRILAFLTEGVRDHQ